MTRLCYVSESPSNHVGFTAYVKESRRYELGELVLFENVISNYGGHYQSDQSVFICPYSASYIFFVSVTSMVGPRSIYVDVKLNDMPIARALADNQDDEYSNGSNMVVIQCTEGDKVWVESIDNHEEIAGGMLSTFSGFLLHFDS